MPESQVFDTPDGDPCVVCGAVTGTVCGHCDRPVCPDDLLEHWRTGCDLTRLGPTTRRLMGLEDADA